MRSQGRNGQPQPGVGLGDKARIVSDEIAGRRAKADYSAIPRVVFSDPEIAAVGLFEAQASEQGLDVATSRIRLAEPIAPPWTYEKNPSGDLGLTADRDRRIRVGAWAVAPLAGWIHQAVLEIKAEIPSSSSSTPPPSSPPSARPTTKDSKSWISNIRRDEPYDPPHMARPLLARIHNPTGRQCGCPPECICHRTTLGRALRWYIPGRFHTQQPPETKRSADPH